MAHLLHEADGVLAIHDARASQWQKIEKFLVIPLISTERFLIAQHVAEPAARAIIKALVFQHTLQRFCLAQRNGGYNNQSLRMRAARARADFDHGEHLLILFQG
jgi:hypothetical protein